MLDNALLDYVRAVRRAKLAEVAALERLERTLLTARRAPSGDEEDAPPEL